MTKTSRRDLLKGAAIAGVTAGAGTLTGCDNLAGTPGTSTSPGDGTDASRTITARTFAEAEKLMALDYTPAERQMMLSDFEESLEGLKSLRAIEMPNDLAPALTFDPRVPRARYGRQKNILELRSAQMAETPSDEADIAFASVRQQGAWLRAGVLSAQELTDVYLRRIETLAPQLECFVTINADRAREDAAKADADFADGRDRGPLHGIPYGLKDLADVKGGLTTWGATPYRERIAEDDADIVSKLDRAGAILLGKTTCGAIAYGDRWFGGRTRNPWNPAEGSSGSSAGSAAATAAGLCAFSIGTETLGSIVSPSERCGTAGLRPTFGRVSRDGFMALCWSLDKVGPICRTVEDTAIVLSQTNGYDADDPITARYGFTYQGDTDLSALTVGYVPAWFEQGDAVDRAALDALRGLGVTVKEFAFPQTDFSSLVQIVLVEAAAAFADLTLSDEDDTLVWQDPQAWPNTWRKARFVSAVDYVQIDRLRRRLMSEMHAAFEGFDALIGPHYAGGALLATNCTGQPQLALRAGFMETATRDGFSNAGGDGDGAMATVPRGISLWADLFQEGKIVALGAALEEALGAHDQRPPLFG